MSSNKLESFYSDVAFMKLQGIKIWNKDDGSDINNDCILYTLFHLQTMDSPQNVKKLQKSPRNKATCYKGKLKKKNFLDAITKSCLKVSGNWMPTCLILLWL